MNGSVLYAVACVVVPLVWGLLVWAVTNRLERSLGKRLTESGSIAQDDQV